MQNGAWSMMLFPKPDLSLTNLDSYVTPFAAPLMFLLRGATMLPSDQPPHGLFFKWGRLEIGASGIPAIIAVCILVLAVFCGRWLGLW